MAVLVRPDKRVVGVWLAVVAVAFAVALAVVLARSGTGLIDLRVYRVGGQAWLEGVRLYAEGFPKPLDGPALPFTYPPIAAVLFSVLAVVPWSMAVLLWTGTGLALLALVCLVTARHVYGRGAQALLVGLGVAAGSLVLEPVSATLDFGQINLLLMGLVALDCLLPRTRWPRGLLIGFAAAIKLTPAIFVLFFLARGRWKPVLTTVASFVGFGLAGLALAPTDTKQYWLDSLLDPGRVGGLAYVGNQSLRGVVHRLGLTGLAESATWALLSLAVVALVWVAVRRSRDEVSALLAVAVGGLLISPVSWSHHWVWVAPGLILLTGLVRARPPQALTALAVLLALFLIAPQWYLPHEADRELAWSWWQHVVGDAYVWAGLVVLAVLAARRPATADAAADAAADATTDR
ncbi:glycosyltransferase 87 family protein [Saccharothrix coeruleofusca]|uniref:Membrane protein n=1 Tax=Saccharothrix coeruleofusca TaxID=33919 RepID=A0A918AK47_9PSEU|nr:glycosyltransferase 87 family protein [Saccharothrix coeruleofusca]GGP50584.1 membrane protein [Saccharothrix coeruleofusca]